MALSLPAAAYFQGMLLPHLVCVLHFGGDVMVTKYPAQLSFKLLKAKQETFQLVC